MKYIYALAIVLTIVAQSARAEGYDQVARLRELKAKLEEGENTG
jgi:hypothetical protein